MMNIGIVIQARMGSTRLPNKILTPFYENETILDVILKKLHSIPNIKIIVATSINKNNDILEKYLVNKKENVFRGAENDVLERFIKAAEKYNIDGIIRICSDNPFLDNEGIIKLIKKAQNSNADYIGYKINNQPSIKTHFGFWAEYASLKSLKHVYETTTEKLAHEHVTIHLYSHPEIYNCEWIECPKYLQGRNDIRLTIDTIEDLKNAQKVYSNLHKLNKNFGLLDIVNYLDNNKDIKQSMNKLIIQNSK